MAFCASGIWEGRSGGPVSGGMEDDLGDKVENAWTLCTDGDVDVSARMGRSVVMVRFGAFMVLVLVVFVFIGILGMVCWCAYLVRYRYSICVCVCLCVSFRCCVNGRGKDWLQPRTVFNLTCVENWCESWRAIIVLYCKKKRLVS